MLTKAWIAILMGLVLGSLLFSSGCGWMGGGYQNNPYNYGAPCTCGAAHGAGVPAAGAVPTSSGTPAGEFPLEAVPLWAVAYPQQELARVSRKLAAAISQRHSHSAPISSGTPLANE